MITLCWGLNGGGVWFPNTFNGNSHQWIFKIQTTAMILFSSLQIQKEHLQNDFWKSLPNQIDYFYPIFSCGLLSVVNFIDLNNKNGKEGFPCFVLLKTNFLIGFCEERNSYIWVWWVATQPPALLPQGLRSWNFATLWSCNWTRRGWYYWCASAMEMSQQSDLRKKQGAQQSSGNICQKLRQGGTVHPKKKKKYVDHLSRLILCGEETIILCWCQ